MRIKNIITITLTVFSMSIGAVTAGELAPDLERLVKAGPPDSLVEIVIQIDRAGYSTKALQNNMAAGKTRTGKHRAGIEYLKNASREAQTDIVAVLSDLTRNGRAKSVREYWITDAVSAMAALSEIENISRLDGVSLIFLPPQILPIEATASSPPLQKKAAGVQDNIIYVGADQAWSAGYDGTGTVVCSFDTGVEGDHPALADNWKGLDGNSSAAWYDPYGGTSFPQTFAEAGGSRYHGSHVMGIMVGHDESTGDTIGVAPGAKWISAAVIDLPYTSLLRAFEWAADPDGDPNTISDVPDVINHSWGIAKADLGCIDYLGDVIDNLEALGVVNIFAAGNEGPSAMTITYPANRANDNLDNFAVGNFNMSTDTIYYQSSRGPSDCDGSSIKPNVVAPGYQILSAYNGDYDYRTGTSMAAPHVAGAVAILRQAAPNATPAEIKAALLNTAIPLPDGASSPNNDFGWGMIDIPAALAQLTPSTTAVLKLYELENPLGAPGTSISGYIHIVNSGTVTADNVTGTISLSDAGLTVTQSAFSFGNIAPEQIVSSDVEFTADIDGSVESGTILTATMAVSIDGTPYGDITLFIRTAETAPDGTPSFYTYSTGQIDFTISSFGQYGFASGSFLPLGEAGFTFGGSANQLFEGAFLVGYDEDHISDGARNFIAEPDNDFAVAENGTMQTFEPGTKADLETYAVFDDSFAENPIGLEITQRTFGWTTAPDNDFIIMQYAIKNNSSITVSQLAAGLLMDWDIITPVLNAGAYDAGTGTAYMYYDDNTPPPHSDYRGIRVLNAEGVYSNKFMVNGSIVELTELEKATAIGDNGIETSASTNSDKFQIISTGPFDLAPGESDTAAFAIVAADDIAGLLDAAGRAEVKYQQVTDIAEIPDERLPSDYALGQNYPNPFNPSTRFELSLPVRSEVRLTVFNILGERVKVLVERELAAGKYRVEWDGTNDNGRPVASGVYFYAFRAGDRILSRKMLLLR